MVESGGESVTSSLTWQIFLFVCLFWTSSLCQFSSHTELETEKRSLLFMRRMVSILCFICKILIRSLKLCMHAWAQETDTWSGTRAVTRTTPLWKLHLQRALSDDVGGCHGYCRYLQKVLTDMEKGWGLDSTPPPNLNGTNCLKP